MTTIARVWGREAEPPISVAADDIREQGESKAITLPVDHPLAAWLLHEAGPIIPFLTIDGDGDRWAAPLHHWDVYRDATGARLLNARWIPHPMWKCPELPA